MRSVHAGPPSLHTRICPVRPDVQSTFKQSGRNTILPPPPLTSHNSSNFHVSAPDCLNKRRNLRSSFYDVIFHLYLCPVRRHDIMFWNSHKASKDTKHRNEVGFNGWQPDAVPTCEKRLIDIKLQSLFWSTSKKIWDSLREKCCVHTTKVNKF